MKRTIYTVAAAATLALLASPAISEGKPDRAAFAERMFTKMDSDNDGDVSFEEFTAATAERAKKRFEAMDVDKDGHLSGDEISTPFDRKSGRHKPQP